MIFILDKIQARQEIQISDTFIWFIYLFIDWFIDFSAFDFMLLHVF